MDIPWSALGSTANPTGASVNPFGPGGAYPYGFNFFNPMVGMSFPGVSFPGAGLPFGSFPGGLPFGPFPFTQPSQPEDRAQDEQGDASSPRKHAAGSATTTDAGDVGGAEGAGRFARNSAIQAGTLAPSAVNLAEMLPSTNSLMSFSTAPLHAMRSLHGSVNALPMLDALAAQGASLEFLQGMTSSMSAAMLQAGSPKHTSPINGHAALTGGYDDASRSMPAPASLTHSKSSNALGSLFNGAVAGGLAGPPLAIAPLAAGIPEAVHATRAAAAGGRRGGEAGSSGNGLHPDQLANNTMAQLQAFLHQSQAVMAPRPSAGRADGGGASARKASGSNGRQAGGGDTPMRTAGSITGGRRGAGTGRSASNPQLGSDGGPTSTRGRAGLSTGGSGGMGMPRISSLQALVEVAAAACEDDGSAGGMGTTNGSMAGTESADDLGDDRQHGDEGDMKRLKRKQSNRESARRSRLKKQAEADALTRATSELQAENSALRAALAASQGLMNKLVQEKAELIDVVRGLGQEVSNELEWTVPVIHMPPFGKTSTGHQ